MAGPCVQGLIHRQMACMKPAVSSQNMLPRDQEARFGGVIRLYGREGFERIQQAHVGVIGLGGVGSWTVEALARSGVGQLTLVDLDDVCTSNVNRQLHALDGTIGRSKVEVMAERIRLVNPACRIRPVVEFFSAANAEFFLSSGFDCVFDAIDNVPNKCLLLARCRQRNIPIVTCGGAGGRRDATRIRVTDLSHTSHDRLLQRVREILRTEHGFPGLDKPYGIECVYSVERPVYPLRDGSVCTTRPGPIELYEQDLRLNCDGGFGSATFVTGAFGFIAAGLVVRYLADGNSSATIP